MVTPCRRFDQRGLLLLERGQPLTGPLREHLEDCPDCQEARRIHQALQADLSRLGQDQEPPAGWQQAVRNRIQSRSAALSHPPAHRPWRLWAGLAAAVAAVAMISVLLLPSSPPGLTVSVEQGPTRMRGSEAQPGDLVTLEATFGNSASTRNTELRLYRDDRTLVARCPGSEGCEVGRRWMRLTLPLPTVGTYQSVLVYGPRSLPAAGAGLDPDSGAVLEAGGRVELGRELTVR